MYMYPRLRTPDWHISNRRLLASLTLTFAYRPLSGPAMVQQNGVVACAPSTWLTDSPTLTAVSFSLATLSGVRMFH